MKSLLAGAVAALSLAFPAAAETILIENVSLVDGRGGPAAPAMNVLIEGTHITAVSPTPLDGPEDARRIDGAGKYLMPGMIDVHIHLRGAERGDGERVRIDRRNGEAALASFLYSGVTSIYDAGNWPDYILALRADERTGKIESPRIFATGGIVTYPGSHGGGPGATLIDEWPEAESRLDAHLARVPDMVKFTLEERGWGARPLIPLLPVDLLEHAVEYVNDAGVRTTAHTSSELRAREAIFAGVDSLAHPVIQGPISEDFARLMGAKKTPMATTLTIGENYSRLAEHPDYLDQPLYRASLSPAEIDELKTSIRADYVARPWTWWMKLMTPIAQENLRQIHGAGGVLALGTDQTIGPAVHREMELLAAADIPAADIVRIATLNGAIFLGKEDELGSIEPGKLADMVLLDADPTADIENAKKIALVIKNGAVIDRSRLPLAGTRP